MVLEELLIKIKTTQDLGGFDKLMSKLKGTENATKASADNMAKSMQFSSTRMNTALKSTESTSRSVMTNIRNYLNQLNGVKFDGLGNKFKSTIMAMAGYAKSGAKNIGSSLKDMVSSTEGALAGIAAGLGTKELFEKSMQKSITRFQLGEMSGGTLRFSDWERFSAKSSTSDDDIAKMLRYTYQGPANQTYAALNAVDAASYNADPIQRKEGLRGYGTYLQGGWTAAAGMMRDEGLTPEQKKMLQGANTYEERIAAMNSIAESKKTMVNGESLSTIQSGEIGKYNKSLAAYDGIIRGATSTFDSFLAAIEPAISWFNDLGQPVKDVIGGFLTVAAVGLTLASGLGILLTVLSPVGSAFSTLLGKLPGDLPGWLKSTKDKVISAVNVRVNGKNVTGGGGTTTTTGGGNKSGGLLPMITTAATYGTAGLAIGDIAANYGIGPFFDSIKGLGGKDTGSPFKAYHGILDFLGMGNSKYSVLNYNDRIKQNAIEQNPDLKSKMDQNMKWPKIPNLRWPTADDILGFITHKFPKLPKLRWPTASEIFGFITHKFPKIPGLKWPTIGSISNWIQSAINRVAGNTIGASGGGGGQARMAGGDRKSMLEDASLSKGNVYINIDNIPNKSVADYTAQVLAKHLSGVNDSKGR